MVKKDDIVYISSNYTDHEFKIGEKVIIVKIINRTTNYGAGALNEKDNEKFSGVEYLAQSTENTEQWYIWRQDFSINYKELFENL